MRETAVDALSKSELRGVPPKCWHASTVGGLVDKPMYLTIADLKKMEKVDVPAVLQCSGNSRWFYGVAYAKVSHPAGAQWKFGGVGNARWSGVRVRDVLKKAGVKAGAEFATNFGRAKRPKKCLLATNGRLCAIVAGELKSQWSPQQIAGWLKTEFPNDPNLQISHETVYRALFVQARGALEKELQYHLRSGRVMRHARTATRKGQTRYQVVDTVSIRERPPEIEDRAVPGHWEGVGPTKTQIVFCDNTFRMKRTCRNSLRQT